MNDSDSTTAPHGARLAELRRLLAADGLDGFLTPHADEYQSEYLPPSAERLAWLTGFTGSAGMAVVLSDRAAIFVDGRYTIQATIETDANLWEQVNIVETSPFRWIGEHMSAGQRFGYDPWLTTVAQAEQLSKRCQAGGITPVAMAANPIDRLWANRPTLPRGAVSLHPPEFAGQPSSDKITELRRRLTTSKADATVLTQADSTAWIFNIRGSDIAHNPVPLAFAIVRTIGTPQLFIDGAKLSDSVRDHLAQLAEIKDPESFTQSLHHLGSSGSRVLIDPQSTPEALSNVITGAGGAIVKGIDPIAIAKARKNSVELAGARAANIRDGAAVVRFLAWLDREAGDGRIDEIIAAGKLTELRADTARRDGSELIDQSFVTISGAGANGAIVHYRVTPETSLPLTPGSLYLVDSGGQYRDGTTDITRTVAIGEPTAEMRDRFTRVLQGHIAIATVVFPPGTSGGQIDALARLSLWRAGLNYDHGTGHGVGSFLSVHEGPVRISKTGTVAMQEGMILSNEPGYYKVDAYGIRIENLVVVSAAEAVSGGDIDMHRFETISMAPIDRRLIEPELMSTGEIAWLNEYHERLSPALDHLLDAADREWLADATRLISR